MKNVARKRDGLPVARLALLAAAACLACLPLLGICAGNTYYVSSKGDDANAGTSEAAPWRTIARVNAAEFAPGDSILFERGGTFAGMLAPKGSGAPGAPITLGAYGTGERPVIAGPTEEFTAAIKLENQEYWVIRDLETTGGCQWGIYIHHDLPGTVLHHFRIINCFVHDVAGMHNSSTGKNTGCIVFNGTAADGHFDDVLVDGCAAGATREWAGIFLYSDYRSASYSTNITFRNCTVYETDGDGIVVFGGQDALIENCVAHDVGNDPHKDIGTPNGIWTWKTSRGIVQNCEVYRTHSPGVDGGAYDIDYYDRDNIVQYNYAHDCDSYGVAVFAAASDTTVNSIVRYNIFANNGRASDTAQEGDFYILTWDRGKIDGLQIYNNTSYWNPEGNHPCYRDRGTDFAGTLPRFFKNNIIYATVPSLIDAQKAVEFDHNCYWYAGPGKPVWIYDGKTYTDFAAYQKGSGQDAQGMYRDPDFYEPGYHGIGKPSRQYGLMGGSPCIGAGADLGDMGGRDYAGNAVPAGGAYDIGACEYIPAQSGDTEPPSAPAGLAAAAVSTGRIDLCWTASTDDNGVAGYRVYRNGAMIGATAETSFSDTGLTYDTDYVYHVRAYDAAGNLSPAGDAAKARTMKRKNLALHRPVTVSSAEKGASHDGAKAVDGDEGTFWQSRAKSRLRAEWIVVDLGEEQRISGVTIKWGDRYAEEYRIELSGDGRNWTIVYDTVCGIGGTDATVFPAAAARYVRIYTMAWIDKARRCRVNEIEIYE